MRGGIGRGTTPFTRVVAFALQCSWNTRAAPEADAGLMRQPITSSDTLAVHTVIGIISSTLFPNMQTNHCSKGFESVRCRDCRSTPKTSSSLLFLNIGKHFSSQRPPVNQHLHLQNTWHYS